MPCRRTLPSVDADRRSCPTPDPIRPGGFMTLASPATIAGPRHMVSRKTGLLIAAEAAAFTLASAVHFITGFTQAAIPELVIAAILALASAAVLFQHLRSWGIAVAAIT